MLLTLLASTGYASGDDLDKTAGEKLEETAQARVITSMRDVPAPVVEACAAATHRDFRLADPGERFLVTDVIGPGDEKLPAMRLIWAAQLPGFFVIHYESGGIAHVFNLIILAENPEERPRVIGTIPGKRFDHYTDFVSAMRSIKD